MRLDKFLSEKHPGISRVKIQRLIKEGAVKVNDKIAIKSSQNIKEADKIIVSESQFLSLSPPAGRAGKDNIEIIPQPEIPLKIVYEDKDIVVVNKQPGLITHPTEKQTSDTLVNALIARYPEIKKVGDLPAGRQETHLRPGIVHRLDKDTSGLIVVAKNQEAFLKMKKQFLGRSITKKYFALVEGIPKNSKGVIEYAIRPSTQNRLKKVAVMKPFDKLRAKKSTRAARTEYKVLKTIGSKYALVEARPFTGRTHQIRVHLSSIGHPIAGDRLYGSRTRNCTKVVDNAKQREKDKDDFCVNRQFLHAYYLKFTAPNGKELTLEIGLPKDLKDVLSKLKSTP